LIALASSLSRQAESVADVGPAEAAVDEDAYLVLERVLSGDLAGGQLAQPTGGVWSRRLWPER